MPEHTHTSLNQWIDRRHKELNGIVLDIDGVLLGSGRRLPGSRTLLKQLHDRSLPYVLLTNDGNHSVQEKAARLQHVGLPVRPSRIISCGHAIAPLVRESGFSGLPFFVMGDTGDPCYVRTAGLMPIREVEQLEKCRGVVVGEEHYPWETVINAVVNFFIDAPRSPLIVPNPDEFYPGGGSTIQIAAGGVARFIQRVLATYGLQIDPIYLGKPYPRIFRMARRHLEHQSGTAIPAHRILMVGDNLEADIAGGRQSGFRTALMLTGVTRPAVVSGAHSRPDLVFEKL